VSPPNSATSRFTAVHARILGDAAVRLWGLSPRERLARLLRRAGVGHVGDAAEPVPGDGSMLLVRGDYVYDDRVVTALVRTPNVLLRVTGDDGPRIVAAHVPAALAARAREVVGAEAAAPDLPGVAVEEPASLASDHGRLRARHHRGRSHARRLGAAAEQAGRRLRPPRPGGGTASRADLSGPR
jgi:hypothetical protein